VEISLESLFEITEVFHSIILFMFAFRIVSDSAASQTPKYSSHNIHFEKMAEIVGNWYHMLPYCLCLFILNVVAM
jgi:hypothetical protein